MSAQRPSVPAYTRTPEDLIAPGGRLRENGYYLSFDFTGVEAVDRILAALHAASKGYHHTDSWGDPLDFMTGVADDFSYCDLIQQTANEAAVAFREAAKSAGLEPHADPRATERYIAGRTDA